MYRSGYSILQDGTFVLLCLLNLLIKITFLFNQTIIEIDTPLNSLNKTKLEKYYERLHILEIEFENKYFLFSKINFIYKKD
jgi:hypothetical protein